MLYAGICANCGAEYTRSRPLRGTTCSAACAVALYKRKPNVERTCPQCGKVFAVKPSSKVRYCSIGCFNRSPDRGKRGDRNAVCAHCGKAFLRNAGNVKQRFCCRKCANAGREWRPTKVGEQLPLRLRQGGQVKDGHTRKTAQAFKEAFPFCQRCGWREEPAILHVHHKDRNRQNHAKKNYEVLCPNCHFMEHYRAGDRGRALRH